MTTETILTHDQIRAAIDDAGPDNYFGLSRAIEQAVLQSDHIRNMQGMADCMAMVRHELIEAGVINESVPPMMVANAVLAEMQALREDAALLDWLEQQTNESPTGTSFDYVRQHSGLVFEQGYRFMRRRFLGERKSTIREAISAAMELQT